MRYIALQWPGEPAPDPPKLNGRVCFMCPTRGRRDLLDRLIDSFYLTTSTAELIFYVDQDDRPKQYRRLNERSRISVLVGPRVGPAPACNRIVQEFPDFDAYGMITDDSVLSSRNLDAAILSELQKFPRGIGAVSPAHDYGDHVDMPFVSRRWIDSLGWFALPGCRHWYWPAAIGILGEATHLTRFEKHQAYISHRALERTDDEWEAKDSSVLSHFAFFGLADSLRKLRAA